MPGNFSEKCEICKVEFENWAVKKSHEFINHYHQVGGQSVSEQLPMNILKLGPIKQCTINFDQQEKFCLF